MTSKQPISEEFVPIILEKAGQLYQKSNHDEGYSLAELMEAGSEAHIPPEMVKQAYQQLQREQRRKTQQIERRQQQMKRGGVLAVSLSILAMAWVGTLYNGLSRAKTVVQSQWAQVENQMQRRADLIPQLTQVAESYLTAEAQLVKRLQTAQTAFLSAETPAAQQATDAEMKAAIAQFQSLALNQPTLQSSQLFINLQYEIAGTENRIATERMRYNRAVETYNQSIHGFPTMLVAKAFGFIPERFYQTHSSQTSKAPQRL